jgi:hypothetical protein
VIAPAGRNKTPQPAIVQTLFAGFQLRALASGFNFNDSSTWAPVLASRETSGALVLQVASSSVFPLLRNMTRQ